MAGVYIHIPFCKQKCHYCNFYSVASQKYFEAFVPALIREIHKRKDYLRNEVVKTVYFGGGTPSLLSIGMINKIVAALDENLNLDPRAEFTLEANPDDIKKEKLSDLKSNTAINRLSIGVQSFFDDDLVYLNRVHSASQAEKAITIALKTGFQNLTVDLIYGIPTLTVEKWKENLDRFFSFDLPHLSAYSLTVEPNTALSRLIKKGKMSNVDEDQSIVHFQLLLEEMDKHGYSNYEISNFAREGFYSKHNSLYWLGGNYLGLGPSAHSFNGISRQWNVSNMMKYIESEQTDGFVAEKEILSLDQRYNEYVMTSIRTSWGCDTEHITNGFGEKYRLHFENKVISLIEEGKVFSDTSRYFLTKKGKLFADGVAATLFY